MRVDRPGSTRTTRADLNEWVDFDLYVAANSADSRPYGDETEAELKARRQERREALRRKRPAGFQAVWP